MNALTSNPAVMASRLSPSSALDFYPTPPWAVRALLFEVLVPLFAAQGNAWEPACGAGHCVIPLGEHFDQVFASDVHDWGFGDDRALDFSMASRDLAPFPIDWVITNPPFVLASSFVLRAFEIAQNGVAMLLRLQWWESEGRYETFFAPYAPYRPALVAVFSERVPMIEGVWDPEASTASAYAWFIWQPDTAPLIPAALGLTPTIHFAPNMALKYYRPEDEALASRGTAKERARIRKKFGIGKLPGREG